MKLTDINIRDPYILCSGDWYYMYGTRAETCWGAAEGFDCFKSKDLENWEGPFEIFHKPEDFWADRCFWAPECYEINGKYYAFHRPSSPELGGNYIWLAESPDRKHWGNHKCVATTREGKWDSARVGAGAPPIRTERGWLEIYHGATHDHRYCLGALLLDLNDPSKVISRSEEPIMEPIADYEQTGFFGNVVFTNGHYVDGDTVHLYYGASDEVICAATLSVKEILNTLK